MVDENGKVKPFVFKRKSGGIIFDVGHGGGAFSWDRKRTSHTTRFQTNVISSDLLSKHEWRHERLYQSDVPSLWPWYDPP
ncbi:MAG: hypothetical protein IPF93_08345 [Saprospiraceae bacterium]|nr:hypothetical protein [Saprospiraceae bacterium]